MCQKPGWYILWSPWIPLSIHTSPSHFPSSFFSVHISVDRYVPYPPPPPPKIKCQIWLLTIVCTTFSGTAAPPGEDMEAGRGNQGSDGLQRSEGERLEGVWPSSRDLLQAESICLQPWGCGHHELTRHRIPIRSVFCPTYVFSIIACFFLLLNTCMWWYMNQIQMPSLLFYWTVMYQPCLAHIDYLSFPSTGSSGHIQACLALSLLLALLTLVINYLQ